MAKSVCYLVLGAVSLFVLIQRATPLRCYVCTTREDGNSCADPFNKTALTADTCDISTNVCVKQILPPLGKLPVSTHRACVDEDFCKSYEKSSKHCSVCKVDLCNSSLTILPPFSITFLLCVYYIYNNLMR